MTYDPRFETVVDKEPAIAAGTSGQYWRGDKTWQTFDKLAIGLGNVPNTDATNPANISWSASYRTVTDTEKSTWNGKQDALVSATNIKTVNSTSLLGSGNVAVEPTIAAGTTAQYWRGDKTWQTLPTGGSGYTLTAAAGSASPADNATLYAGNFFALAPNTVAGTRYMVVPKAGTVVAATFNISSGTIGSAENISVYIRHNNAIDYLVETLGASATIRNFRNPSMSIPVSVGDWLEFKVVCPTWATNPATCYVTGRIIVG